MPIDIRKEIAAISDKILDLEIVYARMREEEASLNTKLFKPSRAIARRIEELERKRKNLEARVSKRKSNRQLFNEELNRREKDFLGCEADLENLVIQLTMLQANKADITQIREHMKLINSARIRLRNKKRAYLNWLGKNSEQINVIAATRARSEPTATNISSVSTMQPARKLIPLPNQTVEMLRQKIIENHEKPLTTENNATLELLGDPSTTGENNGNNI